MPETFSYPFPPDRWMWESPWITWGLLGLNLVIALVVIVICWRRSTVRQFFIVTALSIFAAFYLGSASYRLPFETTMILNQFLALCWLTLVVASLVQFLRLKRAAYTADEWTGMMLFAYPSLGLAFLSPCLFNPHGHHREAAYRTQCRNNLKYIGLGLHNYHDTFNMFPPGPIFEERPLTWRIEILPYIDQQPLFNQYNSHEPWDSPQNAKLLDRRPPTYLCPSHPYDPSILRNKHIASYVALTGSGTLWDQAQPTLKLRDITDGSSNTLGIVEAAGLNPIWMAPDEADLDELPLAINQNGAQRGESHGAMSSYHRDMVHILFMDGSVKRLSEKTDPAILKALSTPNGGETIPKEW